MTIRSCAACRRRRSSSALIHLVGDVDGCVWIGGKTRRPPGRGIWVCPDRGCITTLTSHPKRIIAALGGREVTTDGLLDRIRSRELQASKEQLAFCHRHGLVISGRSRVSTAGGQPPVVLLMFSDDCSVRTQALACRAWPSAFSARIGLHASTLGAQIGVGPRAVLGIRKGRGTQGLLEQLQRWANVG